MRLRKLVCVHFGVNAIKTIVLLYGFIAKRQPCKRSLRMLKSNLLKQNVEKYSCDLLNVPLSQIHSCHHKGPFLKFSPIYLCANMGALISLEELASLE